MLAGRIEERDLAMLTHHKQNQKETMTSLLDSNLTDTDYEPEEILIEIAEGVKVIVLKSASFSSNSEHMAKIIFKD